MAPQSADSSVPVAGVGQDSGGPVRLPPKLPTTPLVLSDWSPTGDGLQYPVTTMDRAVPLCLSSHPSPGEDSDQDQGGSDREAHRHHPLLAKETLVPPPPDGFSEATIRPILAATRDTSQKVYNSRWEGFSSWCSERGQNPISTSVNHVLDFLQLKSEALSVNTLKGYVTAISCRHAMVQHELFCEFV